MSAFLTRTSPAAGSRTAVSALALGRFGTGRVARTARAGPATVVCPARRTFRGLKTAATPVAPGFTGGVPCRGPIHVRAMHHRRFDAIRPRVEAWHLEFDGDPALGTGFGYGANRLFSRRRTSAVQRRRGLHDLDEPPGATPASRGAARGGPRGRPRCRPSGRRTGFRRKPNRRLSKAPGQLRAAPGDRPG